jgi:ferredoxin--NADP+ reductase
MNSKIISAEWIGEKIRDIWFEHPHIADKFEPGQFLVIHQSAKSERIPLTIVQTEGEKVRIIVQEVGYSTRQLCLLSEGDVIKDIAGPLGKPTHLENHGTVVCIAGGIGAAPLLPVAEGYKKAGNKLIIIEGVRCERFIILKEELERLADSFILMSDDGSVGEKGLVTKPFKDLLAQGTVPQMVYAVGPPVMMHAVSKVTKEKGIPLMVSLNPVMVDGTGMCGSCRVEVAGETKFACVDGPEFDGNQVDYKLLMSRLRMYENEEKILAELAGSCGLS